MRCRRCGTELPPEAQFCLHCGAPVTPDDDTDEAEGSGPVDRDAEESRPVEDADDGGYEDDDFPEDDGDAEDDAPVASGSEDRSFDETREVPVGATVLTHGSNGETRVARRREETAVRGETTPIGRGRATSDRGDPERTEPDSDPLDAVEDPYEGMAFVPGPSQDRGAAPVPPPEPKRDPNRSTAYIFIAIAAVVVAAVLIAFVTWRMELWGGTTVPDVMGLSEAEATAQLTDAGFEVAVQQVVVDEGVGTVVSMEPQAGRRVATGRTVEIGIGADRTVPDVEGLDLDAARAKLKQSGIDHLRLEYQNSSAPKGTITSVSPPVGTKVVADEVVTVVVAQPYTVPDVVGLTLDAAEAALARAGLDANVGYVPSDTVEPGRVVSTDPVAGTEMDEGAVVNLSVSSPYPSSLFDLAGYLSAKPEDISTFLGDEGYGVSYGKDLDGVADMTWESRGSASGMPSIAFTPLPFSLPGGFQLFPQDVLRQGARIEGVYLQLGTGASRWDVGSILDLGTGEDPDGAQAGGASIDSRAVGGDESVDLDVSQDCVTRLMNLCGLRSTADTTTTAGRENVDPALVRDVDLAAKAGVMDNTTWYVVVWQPTGPSAGLAGAVRVSIGMAPTESLQATLSAQGIDLARFDDSMAVLAATLVLSGGVMG